MLLSQIFTICTHRPMIRQMLDEALKIPQASGHYSLVRERERRKQTITHQWNKQDEELSAKLEKAEKSKKGALCWPWGATTQISFKRNADGLQLLPGYSAVPVPHISRTVFSEQISVFPGPHEAFR